MQKEKKYTGRYESYLQSFSARELTGLRISAYEVKDSNIQEDYRKELLLKPYYPSVL